MHRPFGDPEKKPRTHFRLVPVFEASQVAPLPEFPGEPLPLEPPHEPIESDGLADLFEPLMDFARSLERTVSVEEIPGAASGYHDPSSGKIRGPRGRTELLRE